MSNALTTTKDDFYSDVIKMVLDSVTSKHSKRAYGRALQNFVTWHKEAGQPALTKATVQAYIADLRAQDTSASVINQALSAIRKLASEAADNGLLEPTLAAGIQHIKGEKHSSLPAGRSFTAGELSALLEVCAREQSVIGIRDSAIIAVAYTCGLRRGSIVNLNLADYTPETGELKVLAAKRNKDLTAYVTNGAKMALDDWLRIRGDEPGALFYQVRRGGHIKRNRLTTQAIYHVLQNRAAQAKIPPLSPHDFRRTVIGDLLEAGVDIATVARMVGHSSVTTTARYDRRPEEAKRAAAGRLHVPYFGRNSL